MALETVGLLHPGEMGAAVGAVLREQGHRVVWASDGRSAETPRPRRGAPGSRTWARSRRSAGATSCFSICPPHAALEVARSVGPFDGLYVDANAISPATARAVAEVVRGAGGRYVDGGIVGSPPREAGTTRLYLSGEGAEEVRRAVRGVGARRARGRRTRSALKMAYAAWTKGTAAMLLAIRELARAEGVEERCSPSGTSRSRSCASGTSARRARRRRRAGAGSARWRRSPRASRPTGCPEASTGPRRRCTGGERRGAPS